MTNVIIRPHNDVHSIIDCEPGVANELNDYFTFSVPNAKFSPAFKNKVWDGKIRLFNRLTHTLYCGLSEHVEQFCTDYRYNFIDQTERGDVEFSVHEAQVAIDQLNLPHEVRRYQLDAYVDCIRKRRRLLVSPTACHAKGDRVLTPRGWVNVESITVGDKIIGMDGKEKQVLKTFTGCDQLYHIKPKGSSEAITVTGNHVVPIRFSDAKSKYGYAKGDSSRVDYITASELIMKPNYYRHCCNIIYNDQVVEFNNTLQSKLTPYFIGIYLGDGSSHNCGITTKDEEIKKEIYAQAAIHRLNIRIVDNITYYLAGTARGGNRRNVIFAEFEKLGIIFGNKKTRTQCENRFIPRPLFTISSTERFELLAGLIDSDGYLDSHTSFEYCSKSQQLANDVQELSISLGLRANVSSYFNKKVSTFYYKVRIFGNIEKIPTRVVRKTLTSLTKKNSYNCNFSIEKGKIDQYYGFEVEDHLYITNGGMITHNSGKSLIIYLLCRHYSTKTLIIVPSIGLVRQMAGDFASYDYNDYVHQITAGVTKDDDAMITVSTWQSIVDQPKSWFQQFDVVIGDEAHTFKAKSLLKIMHNTTSCRYKFGLTGTLDGTETNKMVLEGLFGPLKIVTTTSQLIKDKHVSDLLIKVLVLKHEHSARQLITTVNDYKDEFKYLTGLQKRNNFIKNLAISVEGNTIVLFRNREQGKLLHTLIWENTKRPVYFIDGTIGIDERDDIRNIISQQNDAIIIASYGTTSVGTNMPSIRNIIFASPSKSRIRNLQSIGRGLRLSKDKVSMTLFDIADDLSLGKTINHTMRHMIERIKLFTSEQFPYKVYNIDISAKSI